VTEYEYTYSTFTIDERAAAEALGIDYDDLLAGRHNRADEERMGIYGDEAREIRLAMDELQRETQRKMAGL
jgi:hypothetical protein